MRIRNRFNTLFPSTKLNDINLDWLIATMKQLWTEFKEWPRTPLIRNGNWWIWNDEQEDYVDSGTPATGPQGPQGAQGPQGIQGATGPQGEEGTSVYLVGTPAELPNAFNTPDGSIAIVISDPFFGNYAIYEDTGATWENRGHLQGPQGPQGPQGAQGAQGPQGPQGIPGEVSQSEFDALADDVDDLKGALTLSALAENTLPKWEAGTYNAPTGEDYTYAGIIRNRSLVGIPNGVLSIEAKSNYKFYVYAYDTNNEYQGVLKTNGTFAKTAGNIASISEFNCASFPNYIFKISARKDPLDPGIVPADGENIFVRKTAIKETQNKLTRFSNRKISIIGDSISTYVNNPYMVNGYLQYYGRSDVTSDLTSYNDTWWMRIANSDQNCSIEVNASYSGSGATSIDSKPTFYDRTSPAILGNPDVIIVALGTNDSSHSVDLGSYDFLTAYTSLTESTFRNAYIKGLKSLIANYPHAKIIALALYMTENYRKSIFWICKRLGIEFINIPDYDGVSVAHPNRYQMWTLATKILYPEESGYSFIYKDFAKECCTITNSNVTVSALIDYAIFGKDTVFLEFGFTTTANLPTNTQIGYLPPPLQLPMLFIPHSWEFVSSHTYGHNYNVEIYNTGKITTATATMPSGTTFLIGDTFPLIK